MNFWCGTALFLALWAIIWLFLVADGSEYDNYQDEQIHALQTAVVSK